MKHCPKCETETPRSKDGRCKPCDARRKREARARARQDFGEHVYADVYNDEGKVVLPATPGGVPDGFAIRGVSQYDPFTRRWLKTDPTPEAKARAIRDAFDALPDQVRPLALVEPPASVDSDRMNVYPIGDLHFGMYAWAPETGHDFDVYIARDIIIGSFDRLFTIAPAAREGVVLNVGDFFHANDATSRTPRSGHQLDTDSRWDKVFPAGVAVQGEIIDRALQKHEIVRVRNNKGNHDGDATTALNEAMRQRYRNNPRVIVEPTANVHWYHQFGKCLIGTTHGDRGKHKDLIEIMAADVPELWGGTLYRRLYVGHVHHESTIEGRGATVETFRTTTPGDAWHVGQGYRSGRDIRCHVWHKEFGLEEVHIVGVGRVQT